MISNLNVSLRQLRVFQAVAELQNFSRAGDRIGLTQPAVSRSIHELEAQLGVALVNRSTRLVELTEAGRGLAAELDRVLDELEAVLLNTRDQASSRRGTVRVGSSPTLSANLMPQCIAACAQRFPDIELQLLDRVQQDVLGSVRAGEVDFAAVIDPPEADDLALEVIQRDPFVLVCPAGHALAARREVRWKDLQDWPLVLLDHVSGSRRLIDQSLARHGIAPRVAQELGHPTTVFRMVAAGIGVSVLPGLALPSADLQALAVRPLVPRVERRIMLARRRHRALAPRAAAVWQLVRELA
ncbi:MAG: HTH-type transcriptional regulator GltC [Paracidovorax wautersii]|uniref:HTH-type transcriptional regulator GltC n=1 Tax=Paracidovorax wautersii TaxID=1177982 RepID=A0A7V8FSG4_9BURK|nr:MAG: HTH-type transcriptional regulator GltC [Paracidovorax wautersii]